MKLLKRITVLTVICCLISSFAVCFGATIENRSASTNGFQLVIDEFFTIYYDSLKTKTSPDLSAITIENENTLLYGEMIDYEVRAAKVFNTGFDTYSFSYEILNSVSDETTATVDLALFTEISYEDIEGITERYNKYSFDLEKVNGNWKIKTIDSDHIVFTEFIDALSSVPQNVSTASADEQAKALADDYIGDLENMDEADTLLFRAGNPESSAAIEKSTHTATTLATTGTVSYNWHFAVAYADEFALTDNDLFYVATASDGTNMDCTNYVSQCVWAGYGGWDFDASESTNAANIANHYRMYYTGGSNWYSTNWFGHSSGGSGPWESVTGHYNYVTGNPQYGPSGNGYNDNASYTGVYAAAIEPGETLQFRNPTKTTDYKHSIFVITLNREFPYATEYKDVICNAHNGRYHREPLTTWITAFGGTSCYMREIVYGPANFPS